MMMNWDLVKKVKNDHVTLINKEKKQIKLLKIKCH